MYFKDRLKWTSDKVVSDINNVIEGLELDRMPSNSEINEWTGNYALSNIINKTGGLYKWAERLQLKTKDSESKLGIKYEDYVANILLKKDYKVKRMTTKHPYDLLINNLVKIDVKVANLYKNETVGNFHTFNLEKKYPTCDIYIAITLINKEIDRIFIIPSKFLNITQLSIGKESIYNKYIDRWDYIREYADFYEEVI